MTTQETLTGVKGLMKIDTYSTTGWMRLLGGVVLLAALAGGCARGPAKASAPAAPVIFPPPPEKGRVQYLGAISSPQDLPRRRSRFAEFVIGAEPLQYPLAKPIAAVLAEGRLYVCDTVFNSVIVYNMTTGEARPLLGDTGIGKIKQPNNITTDEQGRFYVADKERGAVLVYGPDERFITAWGRPGEIEPVDMAVGKDAIYVCDIKNNRVEAWDKQTGKVLRSFGGRGQGPGQFYNPTQVALDPEGNVYVCDTFNFRVQKLSPEGKPLMQIGRHGDALGQFALPKGIDVDGQGRLYAVDARFDNVQIFDKDGRLLMFFGGPSAEQGNLDLPAGITLAPWPQGVGWLQGRLAPGFEPEYLAIVVSQKGDAFVNFFAVAKEP